MRPRGPAREGTALAETRIRFTTALVWRSPAALVVGSGARRRGGSPPTYDIRRDLPGPVQLSVQRRPVRLARRTTESVGEVCRDSRS